MNSVAHVKFNEPMNFKTDIPLHDQVDLNETGQDIPKYPDQVIAYAQSLIDQSLAESNQVEKAKLIALSSVYYRRVRKLNLALELIEEAISLVPSDSPLLLSWNVRRGHVLHWMGKFDDANECFDSVIASKSSYVHFAYQHKGKCLLDSGNPKLALACFNLALEIRHELGDESLIESTDYAIKCCNQLLLKTNLEEG